MTTVPQEESSGWRLNLIPEFEVLRTPTYTERQRLIWVPRGTPRTVQGISTKGGFYVQPPGDTHFSFAVDELLPVGRAENARPLSLRPGQFAGYRQLNPDQRAAYLHWLCSRNQSADATPFCTQLHVAALEWSLFIERTDLPPKSAHQVQDHLASLHKECRIKLGRLGRRFQPAEKIGPVIFFWAETEQGLDNACLCSARAALTRKSLIRCTVNRRLKSVSLACINMFSASGQESGELDAGSPLVTSNFALPCGTRGLAG